jgi:hypothetical protein
MDNPELMQWPFMLLGKQLKMIGKIGMNGWPFHLKADRFQFTARFFGVALAVKLAYNHKISC